MERSVSRSPPAAGCCPGQRPAEGRAAASWCSSVPSAQPGPAAISRRAAPPAPAQAAAASAAPPGGGARGGRLSPPGPAPQRRGAGERAALRQRGGGARSCLAAPEADAQLCPAPRGPDGRRRRSLRGGARPRTGTRRYGCRCRRLPGEGHTGGEPWGLWVRGPGQQGPRRGREMPVHQRYPGLPLGLRWSRGGRRDSAPGVGEPRAGTGTVETHRRAGGRTEPPPRASGLNSRASSHCGTCVCPAAGGLRFLSVTRKKIIKQKAQRKNRASAFTDALLIGQQWAQYVLVEKHLDCVSQWITLLPVQMQHVMYQTVYWMVYCPALVEISRILTKKDH